MKNTPNYNLNKPDGNDYAKIESLNENADIIDGELKRISTAIGNGSAGNDILSRLDALETKVGNLNNLETTQKANLVAAINEVRQSAINAWQKGVYNDTNIVNLGKHSVTKIFSITANDWKSSTNVEFFQITIPIVNFSGVLKLTYATSSGHSQAKGGAEVLFNIAKFTDTMHYHSKEIISISPSFAKDYFIRDLYHEQGHINIVLFKAPTARNPVTLKVEAIGIYDTLFQEMKDAYAMVVDTGSPTNGGYPWTPQVPTILMASTYNASNTITNVGANRATRVFNQISWQASAGTPELWESILIMTKPVWGILELDIAGYSAAAGGAKIVVELGISVPNDTTSPSNGFRNEMKVISASPGFTDNFYVRVEHRPAARYLIIQVFKRYYNDPVSVVATFTSTVSPQAAFETLKSFADGMYYSGINAPPELQKDFDARITENFTLVSDVKKNVAQAITDKGVPTSPDATGAQMATNIRAIKTGKKTDRGTINIPALAAGATTSVNMVVYFKPSTVVLNLDGRYMVDGQLHGNDWANRHSVYDIRVVPYDSTNWMVTFFIRGGQFGASQQYNYALFIE